jgi:hypothetical protein
MVYTSVIVTYIQQPGLGFVPSIRETLVFDCLTPSYYRARLAY